MEIQRDSLPIFKRFTRGFPGFKFLLDLRFIFQQQLVMFAFLQAYCQVIHHLCVLFPQTLHFSPLLFHLPLVLVDAVGY